MAWSGGTYTKGNNVSGGWVGDASVGIGIEAGRHDTQDNDFATGINTCLTKDGQNAATADLPMGGFKHTNVATATARNNYAAVSQVQDGDYIWLGTTAGTAIAMTASATPAITAYKAGQKFRMKIGVGLGSTGSVATAHTLNVNSVGAKNLVNNEDATNPTLGTWIAGAIMEVVYDGTNFVITNSPGGRLTWTPTVTPVTGSNSGTTIVVNYYEKRGKLIYFNLAGYFSLITASTTAVNFTIPVRAFAHSQIAGNGYISNATTVSGWSTIQSPVTNNTFAMSRYDSGNLLIGTVYFGINGSYYAE
jgi:hypothetical protein